MASNCDLFTKIPFQFPNLNITSGQDALHGIKWNTMITDDKTNSTHNQLKQEKNQNQQQQKYILKQCNNKQEE